MASMIQMLTYNQSIHIGIVKMSTVADPHKMPQTNKLLGYDVNHVINNLK